MIISKLHKPLNEDQKACVEILKETLAQALEGNFSAIGIVVCMEKGYAHAMAGRRAADLYLGCGSMQREILDAVEGAGNATVSNIIKGRCFTSHTQTPEVW